MIENLRKWLPVADPVPIREKLLAGAVSLVAILAVLYISDLFLGEEDLPLIVASMGAATVLLFAIPHGPMSQPWPLVGGHFVSTIIGIACARMIPDLFLAAAVAVGLAISAMYLLRCLHPPGGASALTVVFGGPEVMDLGYRFLMTPLAMNLAVLLVAALVINNVLPGRTYPAVLRRVKSEDKEGGMKRRVLEKALSNLGTYVDVSVDELEQICTLARQAQDQLFGPSVCADIMTREVITAEYDTPVEQVWEWMVRHRIRSVPVVDRKRFVIGIITTQDFLKQVLRVTGATWSERFRNFLIPSTGLETDKPEVVGHLMSRPVVTAYEDQPLAEVMPLFSRHGFHHLPVVDRNNKLAGIISEHDLVQLLDLATVPKVEPNENGQAGGKETAGG